MKKIGLLIISKNNYDLLETWFNNYNYENFEILNIDDGSSDDQLNLGKFISSKLNINFLKSDKLGVQNNIKQSIIFFKKLNIEWIIYQHHDSYPLTKNLNQKLQHYINNSNPSKSTICDKIINIQFQFCESIKIQTSSTKILGFLVNDILDFA